MSITYSNHLPILTPEILQQLIIKQYYNNNTTNTKKLVNIVRKLQPPLPHEITPTSSSIILIDIIQL